MPQVPYDFLIVGNTPLAGLLAGLLSATLKRRVCLVGSSNSSFRLARGIDLSVAPVTRPETWSLLRKAVPETLKLLGQIDGRRSFTRLDPVFVAETPATASALAHMRHMAMEFGHAVERLPENEVLTNATAYRIRDAVMIVRADLEASLPAWLERLDVGRLAVEDAKVTINDRGGALIEAKGQQVEAGHCVLADDAAILEHIDAETRDALFHMQQTTAILSGPARALPAPVMMFSDRGVVLSQRPGRGMLAIASGSPKDALPRIGSCLDGLGSIRLAGQTRFAGLMTLDGAPLVGSAPGGKATLLAGLGPIAAFLAPALARLLAGVPSEGERAYFEQRQAAADRSAVAEFQPALSEAAA
jgi:hypothetical protein